MNHIGEVKNFPFNFSNMTFIYLLFGFLFGYFLLQAKLNRFDTISGMATLEDFSVAKAIMLALGIGSILIGFEISMGMADFHVKTLIPWAQILGGMIFGTGMAILGYCPGTLAISLGEGSMDALAGIAGGIIGSLAYYAVAPSLGFLKATELGKMSLFSVLGGFGPAYFFIVALWAALMIGGALYLDRMEKSTSKKWVYTGAGLAVLNGMMFMDITLGKPIGASSVFPYIGGMVAGQTEADWFGKVTGSGSWQLIFLGGALMAGFIFSVMKKEFKLTVIHSRWAKYRGQSVPVRLVYAFLGGFLLLFGARMADGCTSGHVISGGMQMAFSSYLFALFTFAGLLITGRFFYRKKI